MSDDVMRRCALSDPLTPAELEACDGLVKSADLYVLINAVFASGTRHGLNVEINLKRPKARARKRRPLKEPK